VVGMTMRCDPIKALARRRNPSDRTQILVILGSKHEEVVWPIFSLDIFPPDLWISECYYHEVRQKERHGIFS
jgi:hypothetical protein